MVKAGTYGPKARRRQLWWCYPNGERLGADAGDDIRQALALAAGRRPLDRRPGGRPTPDKHELKPRVAPLTNARRSQLMLDLIHAALAQRHGRAPRTKVGVSGGPRLHT